jgi:hypothetical protein
VLNLEYSFVWCWEWDTSESRSEISGEFWNVVLEKDGEDHWTDRLAKDWRNKSFMCSCPWCKLLIRKRTDTNLHIKNATLHRPTQDTSHAVSGKYPDIYCLLQHIIHPCRLGCWISTILRKENLWIAHIVVGICVTSSENNIKGCNLVLEEAHYQISLVSQPYKDQLLNFC